MKILRRVILESKNAKRRRAELANKIDQSGGPKNAAEADIVSRENARQEGLAGNIAAGRRAKRQVGRTGRKYLLGRIGRAEKRTKRRADNNRETGEGGAAVHRAKGVEAKLWDKYANATHENTNAAYPLTADRVNEMKRMPGTGPHTPASNRSGALETIMKGKKSGERPQTPKTPESNPPTPGNVRQRDGSSETTGPDGKKTKWGK